MSHQALEDFQLRIRDIAALYEKGVESGLNERYRRAGEWLGNTVEAIRQCDETGSCGIRLAPGDPGYVSGLGKRVDRGVGRLPTLQSLLESAAKHKVCLQSGVSKMVHQYRFDTNALVLAGFPGPAAAAHELQHAKDVHERPDADALRERYGSLRSLTNLVYEYEARAARTECKVGGEMQKHGDEFAAADMQDVYDYQPPRFKEDCSDYLAGRISERELTERIANDMPNLLNDGYGSAIRKSWESNRSDKSEHSDPSNR